MASVTIQDRIREDGKSYCVYFKDPATGKRKYHKTFRRKMDAVAEANRLRQLIDGGQMNEVAKSARKRRPMTVAEVAKVRLERWTSERDVGRIAKTTHDNYACQLRSILKTFNKQFMSDVGVREVEAYLADVAGSASNASANRRLFVLKKLFETAVELGSVLESPVKSMGFFSERAHERNKFLMPDEVDRLLAATRQSRSRHYLLAALLLAVEHGASKQEVLDLRWSDVNFEHNMIRFFRTKNGRERTMLMMPRTREALLAWRDHLEMARRRKGVIPKVAADEQTVICHLDGTGMGGFKSAWKSVCKAAGVSDYHFHDNRHTYCSNILFIGGNLKDASEMIGHRDPRMTNRYAHITTLRINQVQESLARHYDGQTAKGDPEGTPKGLVGNF